MVVLTPSTARRQPSEVQRSTSHLVYMIRSASLKLEQLVIANVLAEYLRNIVLKELTKKTVKNRQKTVRSGSVRINYGPKFSEPKI